MNLKGRPVVESVEQIIANMRTLAAYGVSRDPADRAYFVDRLHKGTKFVVWRDGSQIQFAPSRFVGYIDNARAEADDDERKDGTTTSPAIDRLLGKAAMHPNVDELYRATIVALGLEPKRFQKEDGRKFWLMGEPAKALARGALGTTAPNGFPDEVPDGLQYTEGAVTRVSVNAYERNRAAREACLRAHGHQCMVCRFDFALVYGDLGRGFIHVHHVTPLSLIRGDYTVDPVRDLVPVCPNCHAMLHLQNPPLTVDQLKRFMPRRTE